MLQRAQVRLEIPLPLRFKCSSGRVHDDVTDADRDLDGRRRLEIPVCQYLREGVARALLVGVALSRASGLPFALAPPNPPPRGHPAMRTGPPAPSGSDLDCARYCARY